MRGKALDNSVAPQRPKVALVSARDLFLAAGLPWLALASWCLPEAAWLPLCQAAARLQDRLGSACAVQAAHMRRVAGARELPAPPREIARERQAYRHLERLQLLRCYRPGGWSPQIRLRGGERLDAALAEGRGAILWVTPASFSMLTSKLALHQAGYAFAQLSRFMHSFSETRLGVALLNPIRTRCEDRLMAERLDIDRSDKIASQKPLEVVAGRLRDNLPVAIVVGGVGRHIQPVAVMEGRLPLPTGPAWFANDSGTPLLPLFARRDADGTFTVSIEARIDRPAAGDAAGALQETLRAYARLLEAYMLEVPAQYDWSRIEVDD